MAGFDRVVHSIGSDEITVFTDTELSVRSAETLDGVSDIVGPVLNDKGQRIHEEVGL